MQIRDDIRLYGKLLVTDVGYVAGQIEVTSACFQRCRWCESWRERSNGAQTGAWSLEQATHFMEQLYEGFHNFEHLTLTGGDPQAWAALEPFLLWHENYKVSRPLAPIQIQLSTALMHVPRAAALWRSAIADLRISLDAWDPAVYEQVRGVREDPANILERARLLAHPRLAFLCTISEDTLDQVPKLLAAIERLHESGTAVRRVIFMPVLGPRAQRGTEFWTKWAELAELGEHFSVPTNFVESPLHVRAELEGSTALCWARRISFHVKCNGDLYPCCLVGGEALPTHPEFKLGNVHQEALRNIWRNTEPRPGYTRPGSPCRSVCQYKQYCLNVLGSEAVKTVLSMP